MRYLYCCVATMALSIAALASPPAAPSNLSGTVTTSPSTGVILTWQDNASDESGFVLEKRNPGGNWSPFAEVGFDTEVYTDTAVAPGTTVDYRVRAFRHEPGPTVPAGFVRVPGGTYMRGSPVGEPGRAADEELHEVTLTRDLLVSTTEVRNQEFAAAMNWALQQGLVVSEATSGSELYTFRNATGSVQTLFVISDAGSLRFSGGQILPGFDVALHPVVDVTWFGAMMYCYVLSLQHGLVPAVSPDDWSINLDAPGYRLPTEAEWEYLCRAGTTTALYNGAVSGTGCFADANLEAVAHYCGNANLLSDGRRLTPNSWGLYDMHGNAQEWCADWYGAYPTGLVADPRGPSVGSERLVRGGSFRSSVSACRAAARDAQQPSDWNDATGFRPVASVRADYVRVTGATFQRGSPVDEPGRSSNETPHAVTLTRDFYIQTTEVTNAQMANVMNWALDEGLVAATASTVENVAGDVRELLDLDASSSQLSLVGGKLVVDHGKHTYPVLAVTWYGAMAYCYLLSLIESLPTAVDFSDWNVDFTADGYRLPTEAEWEHAARAGTMTAFHSGPITYTGSSPLDPNLDAAGWYTANSTNPDNPLFQGKGTHSVGLNQPNGWGLFDMHGNVSEWCADRRGDYPNGPVTDPTGAVFGNDRTVRGGNWLESASACRSAYRGFPQPPSSANRTFGFRPVRPTSSP